MTPALMENKPAAHSHPPAARSQARGEPSPSGRYLLVSDGDPAAETAATWLSATQLLEGRATVTLRYVLTLRGRYPLPCE